MKCIQLISFRMLIVFSTLDMSLHSPLKGTFSNNLYNLRKNEISMNYLLMIFKLRNKTAIINTNSIMLKT